MFNAAIPTKIENVMQYNNSFIVEPKPALRMALEKAIGASLIFDLFHW